MWCDVKWHCDVCKYASVQVWTYAGMHVCMHDIIRSLDNRMHLPLKQCVRFRAKTHCDLKWWSGRWGKQRVSTVWFQSGTGQPRMVGTCWHMFTQLWMEVQQHTFIMFYSIPRFFWNWPISYLLIKQPHPPLRFRRLRWHVQWIQVPNAARSHH